MYIGKKELLLIEKQRKLEEKYSAQIEEIFGGDQLSNLTENDYNFRKNIVKSIVADLSGTHPEKIVYVESPNNYDDIFALGDAIYTDSREEEMYAVLDYIKKTNRRNSFIGG